MYEGPFNSFFERLKQLFWWYLIYPIFPFFQKTLVKLHIIHHHGRQPFHLGWLAPHRTTEEFRKYIQTQGFGNHFIAWLDDGQVLGLRKRVSFEYQYHLRVFKDGEIRGHYEETPEDHPLGHFGEKVFQPRTEEFLSFLGDWVVDSPAHARNAASGSAKSHKAPATS